MFHSTFAKCAELRQTIVKSVDPEIRDAITDGKSGNWQHLVWHKSCYLTYISKKNIEVLRKKQKRREEYEAAGILPPSPPPPVGRSVRKEVFDINKCVFCQKRSPGKRLSQSQVMSKNIENDIRTIAATNSNILKRIGSNDLIAMEVKYHLNCYMIEVKKIKSDLIQVQLLKQTQMQF